MPCSSVCRITGSQRSRCRNGNFCSGLCSECCPDVCRMPGSRASLLRLRVLPFVLGGLCCLFASATRIHSGLDDRSLFCFQTNVRNAVLITVQCPGVLLRSCAAVCCRSPYPLTASSPSTHRRTLEVTLEAKIIFLKIKWFCWHEAVGHNLTNSAPYPKKRYPPYVPILFLVLAAPKYQFCTNRPFR